MKRITSIWIAVMMAIGLWAAPRTAEEAKTEALQFIGQTQSGLLRAPRASEMQLAYTVRQADESTEAAYVFQRGTDGGIVIVSANDKARTILGYTESGCFDPNDIPVNMQTWLEHYAKEMEYAASIETTVRPEIPLLYNQQTAVGQAKEVITPLLGNIVWNQNAPFNNLCPKDCDSTRSYTGCVATAGAQIMRYWKHPKRGTGSNSYRWRNCNKQVKTLSADFNVDYDWEYMPEKYTFRSTSRQDSAVALLMYHVGIATNMKYGGNQAGGSGTYETLMAQALYTYFGYDADINIINQDYVGAAGFEEAIYRELEARRPTLLSGYTENWEGHAFVCDGVDQYGMYHINWGWGGSQNGYFALSALDPDQQGIGGAASGEGFHVGLTALVGIKPDEGGNGDVHRMLGASDMQLLSPLTTTRSSTITVGMDDITSIGLDTYIGRFGVMVTDAAGRTYQWIEYMEADSAYNFYPNSYIRNITWSGQLMSSLADGQYQLTPIYSDPTKSNYYQMPVAEGIRVIPFTLSGQTVIFDTVAPHPERARIDFDSLEIDYLSAEGNKFRILLTTDDYLLNEQTQAIEEGSMLSIGLYTKDPKSIVGTYIYDASSASTAATITRNQSFIACASGISWITGGMMTITVDEAGQYQLIYELEAQDNNSYRDTLVLPASAASAYQVVKNNYTPYTLDNQGVTGITPTQIRTQMSGKASGWESTCPYIAEGIVNKFSNRTINENGQMSFYMSEDGTNTNQVSVTTHWLNDEAFITGQEIDVKDTVVIFSTITKKLFSPQLTGGYVFRHRPYASVTALQTTSAIEGEVDAYDVLGRPMGHYPDTKQAEQYLPSGIYILRSGNQACTLQVRH